WKKRSFDPYKIQYEAAVRSLDSGKEALVDFMGLNHTRLNVVKKATGTPALLHWAGVYGGGYDIQTGNYVPKGKERPPAVPESKVQTTIGYRCEWGHNIDTSLDRSLFDLQTDLEVSAMSHPAFNPGTKTRCDFQRGFDPDLSRRFLFRTPIFMRKTDKSQSIEDARISQTMPVHTWLSTAVAESRQSSYYVNPKKPKVFEFVDNRLQDIAGCHPPYLQPGDIVWFSFTISLRVGSNNWWPEFGLEEIIRV
ncbi:hypothetical protein K474DRAFT_1556084, partial [Panus rudis PR-1116 ss-1]